MNFVLIYGPPGIGKLTVATELSRLTGYKLFDNHVSVDWSRTIVEERTASFWSLVNALRETVADEAAKANIDLITTDAFKLEDTDLIERRCRAVERHRGRVCLVQLRCEQDVLEQRVAQPSRAERGKERSIDALRRGQERHDMQTPIPRRESLRIDNTNLSPGETALMIARHFRLPTLTIPGEVSG